MTISRFLTTLALAGSLATAAALATTPTADAAFPGVNGRIAFDSFRLGNFEVFSMAPNGSNPVNLTKHPASDSDPVWSPDGTMVAFLSDRDGNGEIYVMNADGSGQTRLTNNPAADFEPTWSPDGSQLAFTSNRDGNLEVYTMHADGSGQTRLTDSPGDDKQAAWSPDGTSIAFTSVRAGNIEVFVMGADGSDPVNVSANPATDWMPNWSPDGARLAFIAGRDGNFEVYSMNADGSEQTRLTNNPASDFEPAWSPDGSRITFTSFAGNFEIFSMAADGTDSTNLTNDFGFDSRPDWQPLGSVAAPSVTIGGGSCGPQSEVGSVDLLLADADTPVDELVVSVTSSNEDVLPIENVAVDGSGEQRTVTVETPRRATGVAVLTISVTDGITDTSANLTVHAGSSRDDTVVGTADADLMLGNAGDDTLLGDAGNDVLCGDRGRDILSGGDGADLFSGGSSKDVATDLDTAEGDASDGTLPSARTSRRRRHLGPYGTLHAHDGADIPKDRSLDVGHRGGRCAGGERRSAGRRSGRRGPVARGSAAPATRQRRLRRGALHDRPHVRPGGQPLHEGDHDDRGRGHREPSRVHPRLPGRPRGPRCHRQPSGRAGSLRAGHPAARERHATHEAGRHAAPVRAAAARRGVHGRRALSRHPG